MKCLMYTSEFCDQQDVECNGDSENCLVAEKIFEDMEKAIAEYHKEEKE